MTSGLRIEDPAARARREAAFSRGRYLVERRLILTPDGRVVNESDLTGSGGLFATPGTEIPLDVARRYGLAPPEPSGEVAAEAAAPEISTGAAGFIRSLGGRKR